MTTVEFVCWGNICRSPMAERVARRGFDDAGLSDVRTTSSGVSSEELGNPMDRRASKVLADHGYDTSAHRARQIGREEIEAADLIVAMESSHADRIRRIVDTDKVVLLTDFVPDALPGEGVPDPWYGGPEGFEDTLATIEAAMPGLVQRVREL